METEGIGGGGGDEVAGGAVDGDGGGGVVPEADEVEDGAEDCGEDDEKEIREETIGISGCTIVKKKREIRHC